MLGATPCSLPSFDWISGDSGSLSTAKTAVYNKFSPSFWAGQWVGGSKPIFELWHGEADEEIPYVATYNPKDAGADHALDNGLHQDLVANGFTSSYSILAGEGHGGDAWVPTLNASATNGAAVDAAVLRLLQGMGAAPSGGGNIGAMGPLSRRRRSAGAFAGEGVWER
jgi:hypothetical protein